MLFFQNIFYITAVTLVTTQSLVNTPCRLWTILNDSVHQVFNPSLVPNFAFMLPLSPVGNNGHVKDVTSLKQNILLHHHHPRQAVVAMEVQYHNPPAEGGHTQTQSPSELRRQRADKSAA